MLPIRVHGENMGEAATLRGAQALKDRRALADIARLNKHA
jgi:hypothetical protein